MSCSFVCAAMCDVTDSERQQTDGRLRE